MSLPAFTVLLGRDEESVSVAARRLQAHLAHVDTIAVASGCRVMLRRSERAHVDLDRHTVVGSLAGPSNASILDGRQLHQPGPLTAVTWDAQRQTLTGTRDMLGRGALYWTATADLLVCATSVHPCLLLAATHDICEAQFLSYLRTGYPDSPVATFFADVHKVAPGSSTQITFGGCTTVIERYPQPSHNPSANPPTGAELAGALWQALCPAVERRLTHHGTIMLSGGLDSAAVAAAAVQQSSVALQAITLSSQTTADETRCASLTAQHLSLPHHVISIDDDRWFEPWPETWTPTPTEPPGRSEGLVRARVHAHGSVVLTGQGGDVLWRGESHPWRAAVQRSGLIGAAATLVDVLSRGLTPGFGVRNALRALRQTQSTPTPTPWLARHRRKARFAPARPTQLPSPALADIFDPGWTWMFEADAEHSTTGVHYRHPLFDDDVIRAALSVPTFPWCLDKELLRTSLRGRIPEDIRLRPKTPVANEPAYRLDAVDVARVARHLDTEEAREWLDVDWVRARLQPGWYTYSYFEPVVRSVSAIRWLVQQRASQ